MHFNHSMLAAAVARDTRIMNERLLRAFASVPRARFLGAPPWLVAKPAMDGALGATNVETSDPDAIDANVSVVLDRERQLYNGAPGTVATWLDALNPQSHERAFHAGCASGYYTAVLAQLTHEVLSIDIDEELIAMAVDATRDLENVTVRRDDALTCDPGPYDVGLVNTGVIEIPELWLLRLRDGGRLEVPLAVPMQKNLSKAMVFLIERDSDAFRARMIGGAIIYSAIGTASKEAAAQLVEAFRTKNPHDVHGLRRDAHPIGAGCWLHAMRYCLTYNS